MLISEYLALRNQISVTTGNSTGAANGIAARESVQEGESFAAALQRKLDEKQGGVEFSKHAIQRLEERSIDLTEGNTLERLNKGVEIAADKGSSETLVLVDKTAFVVSVKNNKVITTMSNEDLMGNIFTNIDSTVII
ncbi:MAG: TIGR02530 family flagellar biosynthesis protein [Oscillospiraceae bacterium]